MPRLALLVLFQFGAAVAHASVYAAGPEDYLSVLRTLRPGDTMTLRADVYREGLPLHDVHGTARSRITIQGPRTGSPAVLLGRSDANTVSLANASYVTVRDLRIDGAHLPVDGVKAEGSSGPVHHITLERLTIVNHDFAQDIIAISTKCPAWGWIIRDNVIVGAGTGLYLGDSAGGAPFFDGTIENNLVVDSIGYNIEIKHQIERGNLPGAPIAQSVTVLRRNVFAKTRNASVGRAARPNVLVGHFPLRGSGISDRYEVVGNILFDNATEALFQGEGNVTLARNLFFNPNGDAIAIQPHHDRPRSVVLVDNFVAANGRGIVVQGAAPGTKPEVARNDVLAGTPLHGVAQDSNTVDTFARAPLALKGWIAKIREGSTDNAFDRMRLAWLASQACAATTGVTSNPTPPSTTESQHPLCEFLRMLRDVAP